MYETERYISSGTKSAFFRIRDHPSLGVKICFTLDGMPAKRKLEKELFVAKTLRKLDISVSRYVDVILIKINKYIEETLNKANRNMASSSGYFDDMKKFFIEHKGLPV